MVKFVDVPALDRIFHGSLQQKIWQQESVPGFCDKPDRWNASAVQSPDQNSKGSRIFITFCSNFTDNRYTQTMTDSLFDAFGRRQFCQNMKFLIAEADALKKSVGFFACSASLLAKNKWKLVKLTDRKILLVDLISRGIWSDQNQLIIQ